MSNLSATFERVSGLADRAQLEPTHPESRQSATYIRDTSGGGLGTEQLTGDFPGLTI